MSTSSTVLKNRKAVIIAGASLFSALVAAVEYLSLAVPWLRIPFPLLPQLNLKFDMAEIPAALSFFVYGFPTGALTSAIVPLTIIARGTTNPIGAFLKGAAVLSTILGIAPLWNRNKYVSGALGIVSRVVLMSIVNLITLPTLYGYTLEAALLALPVIALFNAIHAVLTVGVAHIIYTAILSARLPRLSK